MRCAALTSSVRSFGRRTSAAKWTVRNAPFPQRRQRPRPGRSTRGVVGSLRVRATGFNHVSIHARNLEESVRFYVEVLGMEPIPTYNFAFPVQYLRLGDLQLHLFERDSDAPRFHHIGINVDDFEGAYLRAKELGILERESFFEDMYELPDGSVQMYLRD